MIGTDIIEVCRIEKLIKDKGYKFLNKIYTQIEIDYCESKGPSKYQHYAGRFAAKEAVFKASSSWYSKDKFNLLKFKDIEILNTYEPEAINNGKPKVNILNHDFSIDKIHLSISHVKEYAIAFVVTGAIY